MQAEFIADQENASNFFISGVVEGEDKDTVTWQVLLIPLMNNRVLWPTLDTWSTERFVHQNEAVGTEQLPLCSKRWL